MSNLIFYSPKLNRIVILEPNIGEYWGNWKLVSENYDPPQSYFKGYYYEGTLEQILSWGWEFIGDYK